MEKKNKNLKIFLKAAIFGVLLFFGILSQAEAAYFYFSPDKGSYYKNENFKVSVFVNSDISINAAEAIINFPTEYLEAATVNNIVNNSIIDLWVQKPSFSNAGNTGNVRFEGVILNPGYSGPNGKLLEITFRIKKEGAAELNFDGFSILANDGLGTNVSTPGANASFVLLPAKSEIEEKSVQQNQQKDIKLIEDKIKSVEEKIIDLISQPSKSSGQTEIETGILGVWKILPKWIKTSVLALVGIAAIILALVIFSFGLIILIWIWSYIWRRREKLNKWFERAPKRIRKFFARLLGFAEITEKEMESDVKYTIREIEKDFRDAETDESLGETLKYYLISLKKIIRRFLTRNIK